MKTNLRHNSLVCGFLVVQVLITGCLNYYKVIQPSIPDNHSKARIIDSLKLQNKVFILRSDKNGLFISKLTVNKSADSIYTTLGELPGEHLFFINRPSGKRRYRTESDEQKQVIKEAHIYVDAFNSKADSKHNVFALSQVQKIEILKKDIRRSKRSYIIGGIAISSITIGFLAFLYSKVGVSSLRF